jgi:hypothetical protein
MEDFDFSEYDWDIGDISLEDEGEGPYTSSVPEELDILRDRGDRFKEHTNTIIIVNEVDRKIVYDHVCANYLPYNLDIVASIFIPPGSFIVLVPPAL